ncbi:hypothetical protein ACFVTY_01815 [Streptomyces sp. NPDC058067]|uniref:hypothetical protein n=1 Tax=Streptomyces sp. NPDC058067 TaxID=3346324 RepID=UPI0036E77F8A
MLELSQDTGVTLPGGAGTVRFGMTPDQVLSLLAAGAITRRRPCMTLTREQYPELRHAHDAWLTGLLHEPDWAFEAEFDGVTLGFRGGGPGAADRLARLDVTTTAPAPATTVAWDDIDLFGYPAGEIADALPGATLLPDDPAAGAGRTATDLVVEPAGLRLSLLTPASAGQRIVLLGPDSRSWQACCEGAWACAKEGDALTGIMR